MVVVVVEVVVVGVVVGGARATNIHPVRLSAINLPQIYCVLRPVPSPVPKMCLVYNNNLILPCVKTRLNKIHSSFHHKAQDQ